MKNFRKVLALVLVVATLFSFAAMAGAKTLADYTDAEAVNYDVAVEVLSALEILNGYEDDTFKPTNTISREEMAKMIAVLANAGDDVSALYAAANSFADVEATRWSASYIAYCAHTGIVAGRSAETFDPYGKVTGLETAKMLLVTMGFDAAEQGYVGANWKINVLRDAKNFGLLNGFAAGYDVDAAITREEAANMMLNALQAPVVIGVLSDDIVKITNALYNKEHGIQATLKDAEKYGWIKLYGNVIVADEDLTLGEALYNNRLQINPASDCYGRPGAKWTLTNKKGTEIFEGKFIADAIVASDYTGEIDLNKVLEEEYELGTYGLTAYVDGKKDAVSMTAYNDNGAGTDDTDHLDDFAAANIGKGVLVEVYVDDADTEITIVVINTRIGVVEATVKGSDRFYIKGTGLCFSNKTYGFEQDDVILYWLCGETATDLHNAQIAVPTTAAITRGEKSNNEDVDSTFTAGGKVYEYAAKKLNQGIVGTTEVDASKNDDVTYDIYTDLYGYVMMWTVHEEDAEEFYAYIVEKSGKANHAETLGDGTVVYTAEKTFVDFTAAVKEGTAVDSALWLATLNDSKDIDQTIGSLVKYTIDDEGRATVAEDGWATTAYGASLNADGDLVYGDNVAAYGNDDTKYLVRTWNYETEAYEYAAYTQDTLPSGFKGFVANEGDYDNSIQYFSELAGTTFGQKANVLTYVFIDAQFAVNANRALILDHYKSVTDAKFINKIGACDYYEAVVNGTAGYVILTDPQAWYINIPAWTEFRAPILVETELEIVGLMDNGMPVYAMATVEAPNVFGPVEFVGGELVNGHVSKDIEDDFFAVVVDPEGNAQVFTDAAKLNDYVETMEAYLHAWLCHETDDDDGACLCETYVWTKGFSVDEDEDGKLDELYVVIDLACFEHIDHE